MRDTRTSATVPRCLMLGLAALLWSGCGEAGGVPEDTSPEATLPQSSAALSATDRCAPSPAAQASSGTTAYYRYSTSRTWVSAKADCEAMGGRLAVPASAADNELIRSINGGELVHLGFQQASGQSSPSAGWRTVEGDAPTYTRWSSGEPNDKDGAENGAQNCGRMWASGEWDDIACTSSGSQYVCEFGTQPVSCGGGATCSVSTDSTYRCQCPSGQHYDVESHACFGGPLAIEVNALDVNQAVGGGNVFVNYPLHARVGIKGTGNTNNVVVSLGLMQRPSGPNPTDAELASLQSCLVAGTRITLPGDGSQQFVDLDGIVPPECLGGDSQRPANFFVLLDGADEYTAEDEKWLIYNQKELSSAASQRCVTHHPVTGAPVTGCVIDVTVRPPPGTDIELQKATPDSSVVVLDPATAHPDVPAGQAEAPRPLFVADVQVAAYGRDFDETNASTLPGQVDFRYDIIAVPDVQQVGWKPLNVNPEALHAPLSTLKPGEALQLDARLHPTPEFRTLTSPSGPWAGVPDYKVRACALVPFPEQGDPRAAGPDGKANNCKEFSVRLVFGSHTTNAATSYDVSKTYSKSWGSSSTIQLALSGGSTNTFDLTGAYTDNEAKATISSFFGGFDMFQAWGDASATVSPAQASLDTGFKVFGVSLLSYTKSAGTVSYSKDISYSKEKCLTYSYGVVVASLNISGCFGATAGIDVGVTASATSLSTQVRPFVSASLNVSGTLNLTLYKATLSASITLLALNTTDGDGVSASLSFAINSVSPLKLTIAFDTDARFRVTTLDGSIDLTIEELEAKWCKKKVWGVSVKYPCWGYDTLAEYNLFSYDGYAFTTTLLDRSGSAITLQ
ncbi:lectin-like protein [Myxococcaceae bacterium GXIMD 01537]